MNSLAWAEVFFGISLVFLGFSIGAWVFANETYFFPSLSVAAAIIVFGFSFLFVDAPQKEK